MLNRVFNVEKSQNTITHTYLMQQLTPCSALRQQQMKEAQKELEFRINEMTNVIDDMKQRAGTAMQGEFNDLQGKYTIELTE